MLSKIDLKDMEIAAKQAGKAIMEIYKKDFLVEFKDDKSPLTEADTKSNEIICNKLLKLYPSIPIMSEENEQMNYDIRKNWDYYWCIDPIDGTKEFIKRNGEFTVNIALIHKNRPILGVVFAPAIKELYYAQEGKGAYKEVLSDNFLALSKNKLPLASRKNLKDQILVVASKSHLSPQTQEFIDNLALNTKYLTLISKGSSLKLCMVASGEADIYPRLAPTMEWDTAAADAIVRESGKMTYQFDTDKPLVYNKKNLLNPWFIVR